jgi:hypothetical protein
MKRALVPDQIGDRDDIKKLKPSSSQVRFVPQEVPINIREMSKEQFFKAEADAHKHDANVLRSLLRVCARAKCINQSNDLIQCYDQLEQISASRCPDTTKIKDIQERLEAMGIILNSFVPREKTDKDFEVYLAEKAEEKMNIRKSLRLT